MTWPMTLVCILYGGRNLSRYRQEMVPVCQLPDIVTGVILNV